jgi:hypothetical protein
VAINVIEGERWAEEFRVRNEGVRTGIVRKVMRGFG